MSIYEFEVKGKIQGKERPRVNMNTGFVYTPNKTKEYENLVRQEFLLKYRNIPQIEGKRVYVEIICYLKWPKNTKKSLIPQMLNNEISPTKKPDVDNIAKSILDAMNGFVFKDDNQVSKIFVEKRYGEEEKVKIKVETY